MLHFPFGLVHITRGIALLLIYIFLPRFSIITFGEIPRLRHSSFFFFFFYFIFLLTNHSLCFFYHPWLFLTVLFPFKNWILSICLLKSTYIFVCSLLLMRFYNNRSQWLSWWTFLMSQTNYILNLDQVTVSLPFSSLSLVPRLGA